MFIIWCWNESLRDGRRPTAHGGATAARLSDPSPYRFLPATASDRAAGRSPAVSGGRPAVWPLRSERPGAFVPWVRSVRARTRVRAVTLAASRSVPRTKKVGVRPRCPTGGHVFSVLPMDADHAAFAYAITGKPQLLDSTGYYSRYVY